MNAQTKLDELEILQDDFINSLDELLECQAEIDEKYLKSAENFVQSPKVSRKNNLKKGEF